MLCPEAERSAGDQDKGLNSNGGPCDRQNKINRCRELRTARVNTGVVVGLVLLLRLLSSYTLEKPGGRFKCNAPGQKMALWASSPSSRLYLQIEMEHLSRKNLQIVANLLKGVEVGHENTSAPGPDAAISFVSGDFNPFADQSL